MPRPDTAATPSASGSPAKQPHWLAIVALLIAGLAAAGLVSYVGSTALTV
ncbi:hypothetical protein [Rhodovibrio sodomensis]|nr:hypothetical protein [Rhodovibrio sodomensis]